MVEDLVFRGTLRGCIQCTEVFGYLSGRWTPLRDQRFPDEAPRKRKQQLQADSGGFYLHGGYDGKVSGGTGTENIGGIL